jgi:hypothetical protein
MECLNSNGPGLERADADLVFERPTDAVLTPNATNGCCLVPDYLGLRGLVGALMCAGPGAAAAGWREGAGCAEVVQHVGLEWAHVRLHDRDGAAAWRDVCSVTPLALDVLAVLVDRLLAAEGEVVLLHAADVLAAKGCRRCGEERLALLQQVADEIGRLGRMSVGAAEAPLFTVVPVLGDGFRFVVALDPADKARWMASPLRRLNWRIVALDHRRNRGADLLAKKLGVYFTLAGDGVRPTTRSVRAVLKGVGAQAELSHGRRGGRLADRFEEAVLRLHESGLFIVAYRGADAFSQPDNRTKGWLERWLVTELVVQPCGA